MWELIKRREGLNKKIQGMPNGLEARWTQQKKYLQLAACGTSFSLHKKKV